MIDSRSVQVNFLKQEKIIVLFDKVQEGLIILSYKKTCLSFPPFFLI